MIWKIDSRNVNLNSVVIIYETQAAEAEANGVQHKLKQFVSVVSLCGCVCFKIDPRRKAVEGREDQTKGRPVCGSVLIIRC